MNEPDPALERVQVNHKMIHGVINRDTNWFPPLQWNPNNPQEIDQDSSVTVAVIGCVSPYLWSVSGSGFSLSQGEADGLSNTLNADGTACGTATITVTDAQSETVTGYVRCTTVRAYRGQAFTIDNSIAI